MNEYLLNKSFYKKKKKKSEFRFPDASHRTRTKSLLLDGGMSLSRYRGPTATGTMGQCPHCPVFRTVPHRSSLCPRPIPDSSPCPCPIPDSSLCPSPIPDSSLWPSPIPDSSLCPSPIPDSSLCPSLIPDSSPILSRGRPSAGIGMFRPRRPGQILMWRARRFNSRYNHRWE